MADLTEGGDADRGQLLLIAGLSLAIVLVALALILNSAIYTQNLATRGGDLTDQSDVTGVRESVERGLRESVQQANRNYGSYGTQEGAVQSDVVALSDAMRAYAAEDGRIVDVTYVDKTDGKRISQSSDAEFEDASDGDDWDVATDVGGAGTDGEGVRSFRMSVVRNQLVDTPLALAPFRIAFDRNDDDDADDTGEWSVEIYDDGGTTVVDVYRQGSLYGYCHDATGSRTSIDLTNATVGGSHCEPLDLFVFLDGPYDIRYQNGDNVEGSYEMTVGEPASPGAAPVSPEDVLYSATVSVSYRTPDIEYETTVTAAPGEPDA
jgi:hypothetical protein